MPWQHLHPRGLNLWEDILRWIRSAIQRSYYCFGQAFRGYRNQDDKSPSNQAKCIKWPLCLLGGGYNDSRET